ncbi:MAG: CHAT domain-containing protein [Bernardetiaceae bacterium]|nr:CHAT domain-containing protein [Bernardetiaceae bacterium]
MTKLYFSMLLLLISNALIAQIEQIERADSLFYAAEYEKAKPFYAKALAETSRSNSYLMRRYADCLLRLGRAPEALAFIQQQAQQDSATLLLPIKAMAYTYIGKNDSASIAQAHFIDYNLEQPIQDSLFLADAYNLFGIVSWQNGNREQAIEYLMQALSIHQNQTKVSPERAAVYNNLGLIWSDENAQKATEYYLQAQKIYSQLFGESHQGVAIALINLADIARQQGQYEQAKIQLAQALSIRQLIYDKNHPSEAYVYAAIGRVLTEANTELSQAHFYYEKALKIYTENYGDKHPEIANIQNFKAGIYKKEGALALTLKTLQTALQANSTNFFDNNIYTLPTALDFYQPDIMLQTLLLKAETLEQLHLNKTLKRKDLEAAYASLMLADSLIQHIRNQRNRREDKIALGNIAMQTYEAALRVVMRLIDISPFSRTKYEHQAFYFAEQSKAAVLLATITESKAKRFAGIPQDLLNEEQDIQSQIAVIMQKLAKKPEPKEATKLQQTLFEQRQAEYKWLKNIEQNYPEYFKLKYDKQYLSVEQVQALLDDEAACVSYFIAEKNQRIYIFWIQKNRFKVYNVAQTADLNAQITGFRNSLTYRSSEIYAQTAHLLYKQLFPFAIPKRIKKICIIPDGLLNSIPFEPLLQKAMPDPNKVDVDFSSLEYMLKDYALTYSYALALWAQPKTPQKNISSALICAPIQFSEVGMNALPGTETEALLIDSLFKLKNISTQVLLHKQANIEEFKNAKTDNFDIYHLATHGIADAEHPALSRIIFASQNTQENGLLYAGDIYALRLPSKLITLSACQTALGKLQAGEGMIGLSRALIYAGAENVAVSLWNVSDASTAALMPNFYSQILQDYSLGIALQKAKLALINQKQYAEPFYWAAFILIGNE